METWKRWMQVNFEIDCCLNNISFELKIVFEENNHLVLPSVFKGPNVKNNK